VGKEELLREVWEGTAVTDNAITRVIAQLHRELRDDSRAARFVETLARVGYRFIAEVREVRAPAPKVPVAPVAPTAGVDAKPSFGPDGRSFIYCSNKSGRFELYRRELTSAGATVQVTNDGQQNLHPAWSPDGQWIAYHSAARRGIWVVPAVGGTPRRLSEFGSAPAWSPDSQTIAFTAAEPFSLAPFDTGSPGTIWTVALNGSVLHQVTHTGSPRGSHAAPSWSRDGKRLAFVSLSRDSGIFVLGLASGQSAPLVRTGFDIPRLPGNFVSRVRDPVFGPGDEMLYFSAAGERGEHAIWVVSPKGGAKPARVYA